MFVLGESVSYVVVTINLESNIVPKYLVVFPK